MFKKINKIDNLRDKKFFIEKINFFIKLIHAFKIKKLFKTKLDSKINHHTNLNYKN